MSSLAAQFIDVPAIPIMSCLSEAQPRTDRSATGIIFDAVGANWCSGLNLSIMDDGEGERIMSRQTRWERRAKIRQTGRMMGYHRAGKGVVPRRVDEDRKQTGMRRKLEREIGVAEERRAGRWMTGGRQREKS